MNVIEINEEISIIGKRSKNSYNNIVQEKIDNKAEERFYRRSWFYK